MIIVERTFEATELQEFKLNLLKNAGTERSLVIQIAKRSKGQDRITARFCKFCGYNHQFSQLAYVLPLEKKCIKCE